jgi:hypothetical protein
MHLKHLSFIGCLLCGCGESPAVIKQKQAVLQRQVVTGFRQHRDAFAQLAPYYRLRYLKTIAFHGPDSVSLAYSTKPREAGEVLSVEHQPLRSAEVQTVLNRDQLDANKLRQLYGLLVAIGADQLRVQESYNAEKGIPQWWIDLRYRDQINGFTFYYRTFQEPLNSVPSASYGMPTNDNTTGGILDTHTIWYSRYQ